MLAAIANAHASASSFESYIYQDGEVADRFTAAFEARGAAGRARPAGARRDRLEQDGARAHRAARATPASRSAGSIPCSARRIEEANYRTHRKALVVDGEVGLRRRHGYRRPVAARTATTFRSGATRRSRCAGRSVADSRPAFNQNWIADRRRRRSRGAARTDRARAGTARVDRRLELAAGRRQRAEAALPAGDRRRPARHRHPVAVPHHRRIHRSGVCARRAVAAFASACSSKAT